MVYIVTIIVLVFLIINYDLKGKVGSRRYNRLYRMVMLWFIAVSAFAYNVGSDTPIYMMRYDQLSWSHINSIKDLYDEKLMPGWNLLSLVCHSISSNFVLFKLVIATFGNWAIFRFIKRHSEYPIISVLFYGIILYLHLNFNTLRQFIAISIFLIGYDYLSERKWLKYYSFVFMAYMFHTSALVCALFPLFFLIKMNKRTISFLSGIIVIFTIISQIVDINGMFMFMFKDASGSLEYVNVYLENSTSGLNINGIIIIVLQTVVYLFILFNTDLINNGNDAKMYIAFVVFFVLNFAVYVVFTRLLFYVQPFYICILPAGIVNISKKYFKDKILVPIALFAVMSYFPIQTLRAENLKTGHPLMIQYVPYYSVFNPKIDPLRANLFGYYE